MDFFFLLKFLSYVILPPASLAAAVVLEQLAEMRQVLELAVAVTDLHPLLLGHLLHTQAVAEAVV